VSDTRTYDPLGTGSLKLSEAVEQSARSKHEMPLNGTRLSYVSTVGHLNVSDPDASEGPKARMFYTAYTVEGGSPDRPVTFLYNGGPGSSSIWLHLASFGPNRMDVTAPNYYSDANASGVAPQFGFVDNAESLLATTDVVFVDAIGTGYSQAVEPKTNKDFWAVDEDAAAFRDFVMRYLTVNNRVGKPFYLAGESYGGPRTAILSRLLAERGHMAEGVIFISPILNFSSNCAKDQTVGATLYISCAGFLPTYAAMHAHYYPEFLPAGKSVAQYIGGDVVPYVLKIYGPALRTYLDTRKKYERLTDPDKKAAAKVEYDAADVAMAAIATEFKTKFGVETVRSKGMPYNPRPVRFYEVGGMFADKELGRYDSRIAVPAGSKWSEDGDPSGTLLQESYTNVIGTLLPQLNFAASSPYTLKAIVGPEWGYLHMINGVSAMENPVLKDNTIDTIPDIQAALKLNPKMKMLAVGGFHDMATPFHQTRIDLGRLTNEESKNLSIKNYEGGHMMYLTNSSRIQMKADMEGFYQATAQ